MTTLVCNKRGDQRFWDEVATVEVNGVQDTIANHFKKATETDELIVCGYRYEKKYARSFYNMMWVKYLNLHPELVQEASKYRKYTGSPADVIRTYIKESKAAVMQDEEMVELIKQMQSNKVKAEPVKVELNTISEKLTPFFGSQSPFSQFHHVTFSEDGIVFDCMEKYMMYKKAMLMGDAQTANEILNVSYNPKRCKELGRKVKPFNAVLWDQECKNIVYQGNKLKFTQNPNLMEALKSTAGTTLVEASPFDCRWGVGLSKDDPRINDRRQWRGANWLGECLTQLREDLFGQTNESETITITLTGHRPEKLDGYDIYSPFYLELAKQLREWVLDYINNGKKVHMISGMALGADTIWALVGLKLKQQGFPVTLEAAIPCANHSSRWRDADQKRWQHIVDHADKVTQVSDKKYAPYLMQKRNEYMVDQCQVLISVWDGSTGGTKNCIDYMYSKENRIVHFSIDPNEIKRSLNSPSCASTN